MSEEINRRMTPEEVEECAQIISNWTASELKEYLSRNDTAQAVNDILRSKKKYDVSNEQPVGSEPFVPQGQS